MTHLCAIAAAHDDPLLRCLLRGARSRIRASAAAGQLPRRSAPRVHVGDVGDQRARAARGAQHAALGLCIEAQSLQCSSMHAQY